MKTFLFLFLCFSFSRVALSAELISFSPEGSVKDIKQVVAKFKTEMVPMGDPKADVTIFDIKCFGGSVKEVMELPAHSMRWADNKTWILDFENPLPAGINCEFNLNYAVTDLAKTSFKIKAKHYFGTGGPRIVGSYPREGARIEFDQYFILQTDGEVDTTSLVNLAFFEIQGINEKVKTKIITGSNRDEIITQGIKDNYTWYEFENAYNSAKKNKKLLEKFKLDNFKNFIVIAAQRKFPDDAQVILRLPKGIMSKTQVVTTEDHDLKFQVIPPFTAEFTCSRISADEACNPIEGVRLNFSSSVNAFDLENVKLIGDKGYERTPEEFSKESRKSLNKESEFSSISFKGPFPEKSEFRIVLPKSIKDLIKRPLTNQNKFPLSFKTAAYSPLIKFNGRFGILEWIGGANLPVSVRNIEGKILFDQAEVQGKSLNLASMDQIQKIINLYQRVHAKDEWPMLVDDPRNIPVLNKGEGKLFFIPKPSGEKEYEMMGIPLVNPGFYAIEVKSPRLGAALTTSKKEMYVATTALVTNMAVHFKRGVESSLVWVTHLNDATPVDGAQISVRDCIGSELAHGITSKDGTLKLQGLAYIKKTNNCMNFNNSIYVFAKKDQDFSFVNSSWEKGIELYRYSVNSKSFYQENTYEDTLFHTLLDRTLFRPGETVSMKHFFREHHEFGFKFLDKKNWPIKVMIKHSATEKTYTLPISVDPKTTSALSTFKLPADALLGRYDVYLSRKVDKKKKGKKNKNDDDGEGNGEETEYSYDNEAKLTASFTIADYRLPLMQANLKILGDELIAPTVANVDISAQYLSGGPASKLNVKIRKQILDSFSSPEFIGSEEYAFYSKKIKPGVIETSKSESESVEDEGKSEELTSKSLVLDKNGGEKTSFNLEKVTEIPKRLQVEMEYTDPNGEIKSANNFKTLYPSHYAVGVKVDSWISKPESTKLDGVVVDLNNNRAGNIKYVVKGYKKDYYSHRKRLVGGFYSYDSKQEFIELGVLCEGVTAKDGSFACVARNLPAGYVFLQAEVEDNEKNPVYASTEVQIFQKGEDVWWTPGDSDRIDLLPEKKMANPGETLKIMVKTPFKVATALVTVEREGVLDSFVTTVMRDNPVIDLVIKKNYAPNVFVSVTLIRGRIAEAKADFLVDLNRPALKMGLIPLKVGWKPHLLNINVATAKKRYTTREKVEVVVNIKKADGGLLPKGSIVTLIAFDESLLLLKKNDSFDILTSMMDERPLAVSTSSGQNQIIGKRHFGSKAKNPGGGGGHGNDGSTRELFNPLLAFIPNVLVNDEGVAKATITLNDSMTSFRIVAVATTGADLFGYGKTSIFSTKDLIVYSGTAPLVRNNDEIINKYTVRNTTEKEMKIEMNYSLTEMANSTKKEEFSLMPSEAKVISFASKIPEGINTLNYVVKAEDTISKATDGIKSKTMVEKDLKDAVLQATLFQLDGANSISVKEPKDSIKGSGGIALTFTKSLVHGLSGVKSYMEEYPYSCLEQQISKAVVLEDKKSLNTIVKGLPSFLDQDGLLKFFATEYSCGSEMLTVYVLAILRENQIKIPNDIKNNITAGLKKYLDGNIECQTWWRSYFPTEFYAQEKIKILAELSNNGILYTPMLQSIKIDPVAWTTETNLSLKQYLKNDVSVPNRDSLISQVDNVLKSRMNFQGTLMNLQGTLSFASQWSMFSSNDQEANLYFLDSLDKPSDINDVRRMARGVVARLNRGTWDSTMANAWGITALRKFSEKFENIPVDGLTDITFHNVVESVDWKKNKNSSKVLLNWDKDSKDSEFPVTVKMRGTGKPWVTLQTKSAVPLKGPLDLGYLITKKVTAVDRKNADKWSIGDVLNVEVVIRANSDQSWVAISDPVPAGASHLGNGLDGSSIMLDKKLATAADGIASFPEEYNEKKFSGFTSYAGYLPHGTYKINYRIRLNSAGKFKLPNTRVEAMYAKEVFGEAPNADFVVVE